MRNVLKRMMAYLLVAAMLIPENITFAAEEVPATQNLAVEDVAAEETTTTSEETTTTEETITTTEETTTEETTTTEEYNITYENIRDASNSSNPSTYVLSDEPIALAAIKRSGYKFLGWFSDDKLTQEITEIPAGTTGDITVYAGWELETYTLRYALKGGVMSESNPDSYTVEDDDFILNSPTRTGYTFGGWYIGENTTISISDINISIGDSTVVDSNSDTDTDSVEDYNRTMMPVSLDFVINEDGTLTRKNQIFYTDMYHMDMVLVAGWDANRYTLILHGEGGKRYGSGNEKFSCTYDKEVNLSDHSYLRDGYTFVGWNTKADGTGTWYGGTVSNLTDEVDGVVDLYAIWSKSTYTITYELNGGTNNSANPSTYDADSSFTLVDPTREGYTFDGWYDESDFITLKFAIPDGLYYNRTLYAKWIPNQYYVTFNGNGSTSGSMSKMTNEYGTSYKLTANTFKKQGYSFAGWNTKADGTGKSYVNKADVKNLSSVDDANVTLYAQWDKINYTITYNLNGGANSSKNPSSYNVESADIVFAQPSKTGYTFVGWYSDAAFKTAVSSIPKGSYGNKQLYAKWIPNQYYVTFNGNGSTSGSMSKMTNEYDTSHKLTANTFKKDGYSFAGWNTQADGTGKAYGNKSSIINPVSKSGATYVLYAQWERLSYTVTYKLNGGKNSKKNPSVYDVESNIVLSSPTKACYVFAGWYSDSSFENKVTGIAKGSMGNVTLYAKWEPIKYNIVFKGNGSTSGSMAAMKACSYNSTYRLSQNKFAKKGYTFAGWNTQADGKGKSYADGTNIKNLTTKNKGKVILYAQWKIVKYKITYALNGGTNNVKNPSGYNVKQTVNLAKPVREGYTFKGWYSDKKFKNKVTSIKKGSFGDKKLYAKWSANTYTITFNGNGSTDGSMGSLKNRAYGKTYKLTSNKYTKKYCYFAGWNTKSDGTGISYKNSAKIKNLTSTNKGNVTLYAQWKTKEYSIKYVLNGGTNNSGNTAKYSYATGKKLSSPTRTGYTFAGWYYDASFTKAASVIPAGSKGNKTVYAKWKANKYYVVYNGNGSTGGDNTKVTCSYGTAYSVLESNFTKKGYSFTGWNTKADGTGDAYATKDIIKNLSALNGKTINLYAQWKRRNYSITYNLNGGKNNDSNPSSYNVESNKIVLANPTKSGCSFGCWYTDKAMTKSCKSINKGSTGSVTLYAKWNTCSYTIKYVLNGGTNDSRNPGGYNTGDKITLYDPSRTDYMFTGWHTDAAMTDVVTGISADTTGNKTFYANWAVKSYMVTFDGNGSTGGTMKKMDNLPFVETYTLTKNKYVKDGYTFAGWNTKKDGTGKSYQDGEKIKHLASDNNENVTLYAMWDHNAYTITYNMNDGTNSELNPTSYSSGNAVTLSDPTRKGYTFKGWYTDEDLTEQITEISADSTGNVTLYAGWEVQYVQTICTICGGTTRSNCLSCLGVGTKRCLGCGGLGYSYVRGVGNKPCSVCYGAGSKQCTICMGVGKVRCTGCGGLGFRLVPAETD